MVKNPPTDAAGAGDTGLVGKISWRRKWQYTPVSLPGKSHEERSLVGYMPCGCKETDSTEHTHTYAGLIIANHRIESCYSVVVLID